LSGLEECLLRPDACLIVFRFPHSFVLPLNSLLGLFPDALHYSRSSANFNVMKRKLQNSAQLSHTIFHLSTERRGYSGVLQDLTIASNSSFNRSADSG
jgi:hypothetical protein